MSALAWMNPALLMGLGAVLIPLALHWHRQRQRHRIAWAAMHLLAVVEQRHKRQYNIQDWLLLCMRILLIALLVLMVARPHLPPDTQSFLQSAATGREHIIILDDSASMMATPGSQSRWAHGLTQIDNFIKQLAREYPQDRVSLFRSGLIREPLMESVSVTDERWRRLLNQLSQEVLVPVGGDWFRTVTQMRKRLTQQPTQAPALYLVSDGLNVDWAEDSQGDAALSLLESMKADAIVSDVSFIHINHGRANSLVLTMPTVVHGRRGSTLKVTGKLTNRSGSPSDAGVMMVTFGTGLPQQLPVPELMPGESVTIAQSFLLENEGEHIITWQLPADGLAVDNDFRQVCHVHSSYRALIVESPQGDRERRSQAGFFVGRGLNPVASRDASRVSDDNTVTRIDRLNDIPAQGLDQYDVLVVIVDPFFNFASLIPVKDWVNRGGVLMMIPDDAMKASSRSIMASMIALHGNSPELAPRSTPTQLELSAVTTHPSVRLMADIGTGLFKSAQWNPLWNADQLPEGWTAPLFHPSDQSPAVLANDIGKGSVLWSMGPTHAESGNWVLHPSFMLWCQSVLDYSVQHRLGGRALYPGQSYRFGLDPQRHTLQVELSASVANASTEDNFSRSLNATISDDRSAYVDINVPLNLGSLTLARQRQDGDEERLRYVINPYPDEMDLRPMDDGVRLALADKGVQYAESDWPVSTLDQQVAASLWRYLWWACVVLLLIEQGYAAWSRLRRARPHHRGVAV